MYFFGTLLTVIFLLEIAFYNNIVLIYDIKTSDQIDQYKTFDSYAKAEINNVLESCNAEDHYSVDYGDSSIDFNTYCTKNADNIKYFEVIATHNNLSKKFTGTGV